MRETIDGALETPDGVWRVEIVRRGTSQWYRIRNTARELELDWLSIAAVERILAEHGVDMASLSEPLERPEDGEQPGAA